MTRVAHTFLFMYAPAATGFCRRRSGRKKGPLRNRRFQRAVFAVIRPEAISAATDCCIASRLENRGL